MALDYKQYDGRWALLSYAGGLYQDSGCGPTSCSDVIGILPTEAGNWLTVNGYASNGSGTYWEGIPAVLQAYGIGSAQLNYGSLYGVYEHEVFEQFKQCIQSGYCGVLLMGRGYWSGSGHFICICGYANGCYQVYDPASAERTGWHAWADFAGTIKVCYTTNSRWGQAPTPEVFNAIGTAVCIDNGVNVRATPNGTIIGQLQAGMRFEIDGKVDGTWTHIKVAGIGICWIASAYVQTDKPIEGHTFEVSVCQLGTTAYSVGLLQKILKARNMYSGPIDCEYGQGTADAVQKLQVMSTLLNDGICGKDTWDKLLTIPNNGGLVYTVQPVEYGSEGASVRLVQELLTVEGFNPNGIDGICGNGTLQAIRAWQLTRGREVTGKMSTEDLKVLIGW